MNIKDLREALKPKGTSPLVRLFLRDQGSNYFKKEFINSCIDELDRQLLMVKAELKDELTPLEKLAVHVLLDSACIDLKKD